MLSDEIKQENRNYKKEMAAYRKSIMEQRQMKVAMRRFQMEIAMSLCSKDVVIVNQLFRTFVKSVKSIYAIKSRDCYYILKKDAWDSNAQFVLRILNAIRRIGKNVVKRSIKD